MSQNGHQPIERRPFRAADVLTGSIDRRPPATRTRKQISAQLEPAQLRLLGELHARLNATATHHIEKSDLVGLGIELLAAVLTKRCQPSAVSRQDQGAAIQDLDDLRAYLRTHVREYDNPSPSARERGSG